MTNEEAISRLKENCFDCKYFDDCNSCEIHIAIEAIAKQMANEGLLQRINELSKNIETLNIYMNELEKNKRTNRNGK